MSDYCFCVQMMDLAERARQANKVGYERLTVYDTE